MTEEEKKFANIENVEDNDELLPTPDVEEVDLNVDPDFIPAPEEDTEEYLPDITPEMVREEMLGVDEDGYSRCTIQVELKTIKNYNPETDAGELEEDDGSVYQEMVVDDPEQEIFTTLADMTVDYCKVNEYTLDGSVVNLELIFDSPYDQGMQQIYGLLDEYAELCKAFDNAEPGEGDLPFFNVNFMPDKYPLQGIAVYSQPFAYFMTMGKEGKEYRILHLMFPVERTGITCYHVKKETLDSLNEYITSSVNAGKMP